jgi:hypothetical protein
LGIVAISENKKMPMVEFTEEITVENIKYIKMSFLTEVKSEMETSLQEKGLIVNRVKQG